LTAAGGASIGVAITQLAVIREGLGIGGSRALFWVLAASVLAGLIEKYLGFSVGVAVALADVNEGIMREFSAENDKLLARIGKQLGPEHSVEEYLAPFLAAGIKEIRPAIPAPLRFLLGPVVRQGLMAPRERETGQLRWMLWLLLAIHLQFALLVAAVIIAAFAA
jgi:hypothetical protein